MNCDDAILFSIKQTIAQKAFHFLKGNVIPNSSSVSSPIISCFSYSPHSPTHTSWSFFSMLSAMFPTISRH